MIATTDRTKYPTWDGKPEGYKQYKIRALSIIDAAGHASIIPTKLSDRAAKTRPEIRQGAEEDEVQNVTQAQTEFDKSSRFIYNLLVQGIDGDAFRCIEHLDPYDGVTAWQALLKKYEPICESSKSKYVAQFFNLATNKEMTDVETFIHTLDSTVADLSSLGCPVPDFMKVGAIMNALPESSYKEFKRTIRLDEARYDTYIKVKEALLSDCRNQKLSENTNNVVDGSNFSLFSKAGPRNKDSDKKKQSKQGITCYACGRKGHKSVECRSKHKPLPGFPRNVVGQQQQANVATSSTSTEPPHAQNVWSLCTTDDASAFISSTSTWDQSIWIVDTGATKHVAFTPTLFETLSHASGNVNTVKKGNSTPIRGIGTIRYCRGR